MGKIPLSALPQIDANIIYAQNMACMAMIQAQQWEGYATKLNQHLARKRVQQCVVIHADAGAEKLLPHTSVSASSSSQPHSTVHVADAVAQEAASSAAKVAHDAAHAAAVDAAAEAAWIQHARVVGEMQQQAVAAPGEDADGRQAEEGDGRQPRENVWVRHRLGVMLKLACLLVLFEVTLFGLLVYMFTVLLYLYGMFDGLMHYFVTNRHAALEEQLANLRDTERRREAEQAAQERPEADGADSGGVTEEMPATETDGQAPEAVDEGDAAQRFWRAFYQSFVMYFLTLVPWWTPDPRNLQ